MQIILTAVCCYDFNVIGAAYIADYRIRFLSVSYKKLLI